MKELLKKVVLSIVLILVVLTGAFFLGITLFDYRPQSVERIRVVCGRNTNQRQNSLSSSSTVTIYTWNIGYGGMGQSCGGEKLTHCFSESYIVTRPTLELYEKSINGICSMLNTMGRNQTNVILLQEVDTCSRRSYYHNQLRTFQETTLPEYYQAFATNYKVPFIPLPPTVDPYGEVSSGIVTMSRVKPLDATRHSLTPDAPWPMGIFLLKRCFTMVRYSVDNKDGDKELVVINVHLSADSVEQRRIQLEILQLNLLLMNLDRQYVVVGGDWNTLPSDLPPQYPAVGWQCVYDSSLDGTWRSKTNHQSSKIIDYFILSPNLEALRVKTLDTGFRYSDHQPVSIELRFI
jgi:endonuclease/exonuclease/phosphatase family metal-dependent hydrolase